MLCLGPFPHGCGYDLWKENSQGLVSDLESHGCNLSLFAASQPLSFCDDPTGFDDFSLHPNQFDLTELFNKVWQIGGLFKNLKLLEIDSIMENPYHWKSFGVRDPRDSEAPHPLWYEADRGDLLFLAKGSQTTPRIFCLSLSEMIQVLSLGSWIYPTAMWYSFLDDFLRKIRVLRDFLEYIVLVFHFTEKSECWSTLTCWYSLMVKNLVCGISPAFEFEILPY